MQIFSVCRRNVKNVENVRVVMCEGAGGVAHGLIELKHKIFAPQIPLGGVGYKVCPVRQKKKKLARSREIRHEQGLTVCVCFYCILIGYGLLQRVMSLKSLLRRYFNFIY